MDEIIDYAVVGGGIAGAYVAWRLATSSGRPTVNLFEASDLLGGRLLTARMPGTELNVELGGMRYSKAQLLFSALIGELDLVSVPFHYSLSMHLRGSHSSATQPSPGPPYKLGVGEIGKGVGQLVMQAIGSAIREVEIDLSRGVGVAEAKELRETLDHLTELNAKAPTYKQWRLIKRHAFLHDSPLYEIGFWNLLQHYLTSEAFLFVHDGLGYESVLANWNAAEAIPWFVRDFSQEDFWTVKDGMDKVPVELAKRFAESCPNSTQLFHKLVSIEREDDGRWLLKLRYRISEEWKEPLPRKESLLAKHVILALPKAPLADINFLNLEPRHDLNLALNSVTAHRLFKLFLAYDRTWWDDPNGLGCVMGKAVTDLPIRQVYYFGQDPRLEEKVDEKNDRIRPHRGVIMASYSDAHYVDFWDPFHRRKEKPFFYSSSVPPTGRELALLDAHGITLDMLRTAHRQVKQLHPELIAMDRIPEPYTGLMMDWPQGWHTWNVRSKPWLAIRDILRPFENACIHICGEAYSYEQGWVEGALRSAEMVLKELGVEAPKWMNGANYQDQGFQSFEEYIGWAELDK